ncbi:hypothetical protein [Sphingomonas prati]|nr:hypothetical protein [Sphingomonas prati]
MIDAATILSREPAERPETMSVPTLSDLRFFLRVYAGGFAIFLTILS